MGRNAAVVAHLGNIAYRTGEKLVWQADDNRFSGNTDSDNYIKPVYRKPWELWET
jgi:hypothetical protein